MKASISCFLLLVLWTMYGCNSYHPSDSVQGCERVKVYWVNPIGKGKHEAVLMGEDSNQIQELARLLFAGQAMAKEKAGEPMGRIDFNSKGIPRLQCYYSIAGNPWISYIHGMDTVVLELSDSAKALLAVYKAPSPERFAWLQGVWIAEGENRPIYEEWSIGADHYPVGKNYSIYGGDTTINEELSIKKIDSQITYVARLLNNKGNPMHFDWQPASDENLLSFSNSWQNFPQDIIYKRIRSDSMVATVKGKGSTFEMGMRKMVAR